MNPRLRRRIASAALIVGFFVAWQLLCVAFGIKDIVLPRPTQILDTLWSRLPAIMPHAAQTLYSTLVGFALGRLLYGEFGRVEPVAVLDAIGVDRSSQEHGYGHALMAGLLAAVRRKGVRQLHSQADWTNHGLLKFFDSTGFKLAQRVVLERSTAESMDESGEEV